MKFTSIILALFVSAFLLAGLANRHIFQMFFIEQTLVFDAAHYFAIAREGYVNPALAAFYPLWPMIIKFVISPLSAGHAVLWSCLLSLVLFAFSLNIFCKVAFQKADPGLFIFAILAIYALNPNSIFHMLPYTESLTALFGSLFLFSGQRLATATNSTLENSDIQIQKINLVLFFVAAIGMSMSRPVALPMTASIVSAYALNAFFKKQRPALPAWTLLMAVALMWISYIPFGLHTQNVMGNFSAPFDAQKYWDRKFGFYWSLIFKPKSVSSSDNVLFWDIQAFYLPIVMVGLPFIGRIARHWKLTKLQSLESLGENILYLICALFAAAHAAIAFFTYPIFMSLGRHVFALPFYFYCVACILRLYWQHKTVRISSLFYAFISFAFLIYWWSRYARIGWLG